MDEVLSAVQPWVAETSTRYGSVFYPKHDIVLGAAVAAYGEWFESEVDIFRAFVGPGDFVLDIGANFGMHTLALASLVKPTGRVFAIEPQSQLIMLIARNVLRAGYADNVNVQNCFLSDVDENSFTVDPDYEQVGSFGSYSMLEHRRPQLGPGVVSVPVHKLDTLLSERSPFHKPSFIKLDAEGSELKILQGARATLKRARPVVYVENDRVNQSPDLVRFLKDHDYRLFWHLAPFFNKDNYRGNKELVRIHTLGYAFHKGQLWFNGVALMMLALPREKSKLVDKLPPGLIEVDKDNEHPCHNIESLQLAAQLAGLGVLPCLLDERQVEATAAANNLAKRAVDRMIAGDRDNAKALLKGALDLDYDNVNIWHSMGPLGEPGYYDAVLAADERAITLATKPESGATPSQLADIYMNHGTHLMRAQRYGTETLVALDKALETTAKPSSVYHNRGLLYYHRNKPEAAVADLEKAHELEPENVWIVNDLAHAVLKSGDLTRGWELMEIRWKDVFRKDDSDSAIDNPFNPILPKSHFWRMLVPRWKGEDLKGKKLLLHYEQGSGDMFQFIRYFDTICERYGPAEIILGGPKELKRILAFNYDCEYCIWDNVEDIVKVSRMVDYHCPIVSAVALLKPTYDDIPCRDAYLKAPFQSKVDYHQGGAKLAVGVVWTPALEVDRGMQRLVPVGQFMDLAAVPGVRLWSLQVGIRAPDAVTQGCDIIMTDAVSQVTDWADTAAVIDGLDAVVTVDTAVAHLSGAMGKPTFMLNPFVPCWRWCKGPKAWYESMEIFDQKAPSWGGVGFDWRQPIRRIRRRLEQMVEVA